MVVLPSQLVQYDVVLTSYATLRDDLNFLSKKFESPRVAKKYRVFPTPLKGMFEHMFTFFAYCVCLTLSRCALMCDGPCRNLGVRWWRVVLDEAQLFGEGSSRAAKMAMIFQAHHRWVVSGMNASVCEAAAKAGGEKKPRGVCFECV